MQTKINFKLEKKIFNKLGEDEVRDAYLGTYCNQDGKVIDPSLDVESNIEDYNFFLESLSYVYGIKY